MTAGSGLPSTGTAAADIGGELQAAHFRFDRLEGLPTFRARMEDIAAPACVRLPVPKLDDLVLQRNRCMSR